MNLKIPNDVTKAARPSLITLGTQVMSGTFDVKGLATLQRKFLVNINAKTYFLRMKADFEY